MLDRRSCQHGASTHDQIRSLAHLDDDISAGPIVDQDTRFSAFTGIALKFGNNAQ